MSIDCSPLHFLASLAETENRRTAFIPTSFHNIILIIILLSCYTVPTIIYKIFHIRFPLRVFSKQIVSIDAERVWNF